MALCKHHNQLCIMSYFQMDHHILGHNLNDKSNIELMLLKNKTNFTCYNDN